MRGKLLLLPTSLDETVPHQVCIPPAVALAVSSLNGLIVESEKIGRRYLLAFLPREQFVKIPIHLLSEHTSEKDLEALIHPMERGEVWGLISDGGLPCIADPGAHLVALAHERGVAIETFAGPSSILMALQLSGFSGQHFTFHGYLPREIPLLEKKILELEMQSSTFTQIWIEAPYRSLKMLNLLKRILHPKTRLCVAANLTSSNQKVASMEVGKWTADFSLDKEPAVFLLSKRAFANTL